MQSNQLKPFSIYEHHSGRKYFFVGIANKHSDKKAFRPLAIYIGLSNFRLWARSVEEFYNTEKFAFISEVSFQSARRCLYSFVGAYFNGENNV